jgi:repressor LexA
MRSADSLSNRQQEILDFIHAFVDENGYPPAIRQIQDKLKISSTSVVAYNLRALETRGLLKREGRVSRGIALANTTPLRPPIVTYQVPMLGTITAGGPLPDPEEIMRDGAEMIDVPDTIAPADKLNDVYALKVRGHSMIDALIDDGDIVLLRYQETAENGQMVAVRLQDENAVTLKRFYREGSRVRLQPANVTMEPIFADAVNVRVEGRVVGVIRSMY